MPTHQRRPETPDTAPSCRGCARVRRSGRACVQVPFESTNDTHEHLQVLGDVVVHQYHSTSPVKDREVEDGPTNGKVDGKSHKEASRKVKTGRVGELRRQASQRRSICRVGSILAIARDLQQHCDVLPETPVLSGFLSRTIRQYKVRSDVSVSPLLLPSRADCCL